jgi:hypothetical protein
LESGRGEGKTAKALTRITRIDAKKNRCDPY